MEGQKLLWNLEVVRGEFVLEDRVSEVTCAHDDGGPLFMHLCLYTVSIDGSPVLVSFSAVARTLWRAFLSYCVVLLYHTEIPVCEDIFHQSSVDRYEGVAVAQPVLS